MINVYMYSCFRQSQIPCTWQVLHKFQNGLHKFQNGRHNRRRILFTSFVRLEVYTLSLHLERSDYSLEQSDYLVERSDQRME